MVRTKEDVIRLLGERREDLERLGAERLLLFGSFARGEESANSDVDLLVQLDHRTFDRYMELKFFLEDLLERHVDLVFADRVKPRLRESVLEDAIGIVGDAA